MRLPTTLSRNLLVTTLFICGFINLRVSAQTKVNQPLIDSKNFVFVAETALSQGGPSRPLTSLYDLVIRPDSLISDLPFFGRAYSAPINATDGGIHFTSVKFSYVPVKKKKGRFEITIKPTDVSSIVSMQLTAFENGRATLQVTSLNRSTMSFYGYINEGRPLNLKAF